MQVWEQQVASLSRQLVKVTADMEDAGRERQTLLDSLRASEQVCIAGTGWLSTRPSQKLQGTVWQASQPL